MAAVRSVPMQANAAPHAHRRSSGRSSRAATSKKAWGTINLHSIPSDEEEVVDAAGELAKLKNGTESTLDLEKSHLLRAGREPNDQEIMSYLAEHQLQELVTEVIMQVARHLPDNPFDFLLNHIESIVRKFCASKGLSVSENFGSSTDKEQTASSSSSTPATEERKQPEKVLRFLNAVLRTTEIARGTAAKLYDQFASAEGMTNENFNGLLLHLQQCWGLETADCSILLNALKRWRVRKNATNSMRGCPLWPVSKLDFLVALPALLRVLSDHLVPSRQGTQRERFIREVAGDMTAKYSIGPLVGHGSFGEVVLVTSKFSQEQRVCKIVHWEQGKFPRAELTKEVEVLRSLDHPNIMRIFEYFQSPTYIQVIMEPIFGGSLSKLVRELYLGEDGSQVPTRHSNLTEVWLAAVMMQLLSALTYAHDTVGVMHKDLKCDNILLLGKPEMSLEAKLYEPVHVVLIDFGLAEIFSPGGLGASAPADDAHGRSRQKQPGGLRSTKAAGTPPYMSPEMFQGSFSEKSDLWSLGVVMFQLMSGEFPYRGGHLMVLVQNVCSARRQPPWELLRQHRWSAGARYLCQQLLVKDETQRLSASKALENHWLVRTSPADPETALDPHAKAALQQVHIQSHLMRTALQCLTSQLSLSKLQVLSFRFQHYDTSGEGRLSHVEVTHALEDAGITSPEELELIISSLDADASGFVEYSEFMSGCLSMSKEDIRSQLRTVFDIFDLNNTGTISMLELRQVLASGAGAEKDGGKDLVKPVVAPLLPDGKTVEEVMEDLDNDGSGQVDFEEFEQYLLEEHSRAAEALGVSTPKRADARSR